MQTIHTYVDIFGQLNNNLDRILNSFFDYIIICLCIQKEWQQLESKKSLSSATVYTNMSLLTKKTLPRNITACVVKKNMWTNFEWKKSHIIQSINSLNLIFLLSLLFMDRFNFGIVFFSSAVNFKMRIA